MGESGGGLQRISLTAKVVFATVLVSCAVWFLLDHIQTRSLRTIFRQQLTERLAQEALEDRLNFDRYISTHNQLVRMLVTQKQFIDFIEGEGWAGSEGGEASFHRRSPPWLPRLSAFRSFVRIRHALLADSGGTVRQAYRAGDDKLPDSLLKPDSYLLEQSQGQNFLTTMGDVPYLVTSERFTGSRGEVALILASPLDDEFLIDSQGMYRGRLVALVRGASQKIASSSNLDLLPAGTLLGDLEGRYIVTGQEFYEYGDSELAFRFVSFISTEEVESLTGEIVSRERKQRAVLVFGVLLFFTAVITAITRRTERLAHRMVALSEKAFTDPKRECDGDEGRGKGMTLEQRVQDQAVRLERAGQLKSFLSPQIAELVLSDEGVESLKPHRREVTVVFADLRGFTSFAEKSEPEEVMSVLRDYHEEMGALIIAHEGTLEHFAGDGIMIIFNDPVELTNPAENAVRMAVAMREKIDELKVRWRKRGYELDCGFGIAQGFATIGAIGFEGRWDYAAIGNVSNLASRLCDEAKGCQILITQKVLSCVEELVEAEPLSPLRPKGISRPVAIFNVLRLEG
jgi:class 3 adenylate cyclase